MNVPTKNNTFIIFSTLLSFKDRFVCVVIRADRHPADEIKEGDSEGLTLAHSNVFKISFLSAITPNTDLFIAT